MRPPPCLPHAWRSLLVKLACTAAAAAGTRRYYAVQAVLSCLFMGLLDLQLLLTLTAHLLVWVDIKVRACLGV